MLYRELEGVITGFSDSSHYHAHLREAAMIDFFGLNKLTNEQRGTYY